MRFLPRLVTLIIGVVMLWYLMPYFHSPETHALKQHQRLIKLAGGRNWTEAKPLFANDYLDAWDNNADQAIEAASEVLSGFIVLDLQIEAAEAHSVAENLVEVRCKLRISGNGAGVSQQVMNEVNRLQEHWTFTWRKDGSKPSDWRLLKVDHPELKNVSMPNF